MTLPEEVIRSEAPSNRLSSTVNSFQLGTIRPALSNRIDPNVSVRVDRLQPGLNHPQMLLNKGDVALDDR